MTYQGPGVYLTKGGRQCFAVVDSDIEIDGQPVAEAIELFGPERSLIELPTFAMQKAADLPATLEVLRCVDQNWRDVSRGDEPSEDAGLPRFGRAYVVEARTIVGEEEYVLLRGGTDWFEAGAFAPI